MLENDKKKIIIFNIHWNFSVQHNGYYIIDKLLLVYGCLTPHLEIDSNPEQK